VFDFAFNCVVFFKKIFLNFKLIFIFLNYFHILISKKYF